MTTINLEGLDKAAVLAALYNAAKPQGMGFLHYDPKPMSVEEAQELLPQGDFDYLKGRAMKVDLSGDQLDTWGYDRDNGEGAAQQAIDSLRVTNDLNNIIIRCQHAFATQASICDVRRRLSDESTVVEENGVAVVRLGLSDVAGILRPKIDEAEETAKSPFE